MTIEEIITKTRTKNPNKKTRERIKLVRKFIESGTDSYQEISQVTGVPISSLYHYRYNGWIETNVKSGPKTRIIPERDFLILQGLTLQEIANAEGITRQAIWEYGRKRGLLEERRKAKEARKQTYTPEFRNEIKRNQLLTGIDSLIAKRIESLAEGKSWAYQTTVRYFCSLKRPTRIKGDPFNTLLRLFERYENAVVNGNKISLEELGDGIIHTKYPPANISSILKRVDLKPLYYQHKHSRTITSKNKKAAIRRSIDSKMSDGDIGYFLGVNDHVVEDNVKRMGLREIKKELLVPINGIQEKDSRNLTYRLGSKIYEAQDLGFSLDEITELYDVPRNTVRYALDNSSILRPKILNELRIIYSKKNDFPYITKEDVL